MRYRNPLASAGLVIVAMLLLTSCGAGKGNPNDTYPGVSVPAAVTGPNNFLLFPNPQLQPNGSSEVDSVAYSQAYYAAIDPANAKDTLAKWKAANGIGTPTTSPLGEVSAVYGDWRDLAYGRRVTARQNTDGTIAVVADNYIVNVGGDYASNPKMNLAAAVAQDRRWFIGASAIEFSPVSGVPSATNLSFTKFYYFDPSGVRSLSVNLDGRGNKSTIGVCSGCHGGRADPLTPPDAAGKQIFPLVQNSASLSRGDIQAYPHLLEVDTLDFPSWGGMTRAEQEGSMKTINKMILCTFPISAAATTSLPAEDACRRVAGPNEWQGEADTFIKSAYGGDGLPSSAYVGSPVPAAWSTIGQSSLYQNVVAPACRVCHILRGIGAGVGDEIDFDSYAAFNGFADRIKAHMIDRGNMPLSKILYERFWATPAMPDALATFLQGAGYTVRDASGAVLKPGRPIADPGPDRTVTKGATTFSGANSLYASTYAWSILSGSAVGATLSNANTAQAAFTATMDGNYVVQLIVGNGTTQSAPAQFTIVVNSLLTPAPSTIRFANIKAVLQGTCIGCHTTAALTTAAITPIVYNNVDRNGDGVIDATDDLWLYTEVRGRVNFADITSSPLLRKPSGHHHVGLLQTGFDTTKPPGDPARANYDLFLNWILNGAPQ